MLVVNMEIPGLDTEAYAASVDHLSSLEKFGRKWYTAGLTAGIAQAMNEAEGRPIIDPTPKSEDSEDLIALLITRNEGLEKKVKELEAREKEAENFERVAIDARKGLVSAHAAMEIAIESATRVAPYWLSARLISVASEINDRMQECTQRIKRAREESKKRASEPQEASGSSSKYRKHN
ncbi:hypothetical protein FSHL1_008805 [Fusarium sambucinum]